MDLHHSARMIGLALAATLLLPDLATGQLADKPNVLFLFTDDQRADTIHALGNDQIITPNLDRLARSGFTFRNAYCMGSNSGAVCMPSRTMMHSGRSLFRIKGTTAEDPHFGKAMKEAGYVTYHHSKKGNTPNALHKTFDHSRYLDNSVRKSGYPGKEAADAAIDFLARFEGGNPFFMYLGFAGPHDPRIANADDLARYDIDKIQIPANYLPLHPFNNGEMTIRDEGLAPWPRSKAIIRKHLRDYYAVITHMDRQIGRVVEALKNLGLYESTIIIFSSDHGLAVGSHGLMGKQSLYEHSMKAPLIFSGPGIPEGSSDAFVYLHDIFPTTVGLVGGKTPDGLDGISLADIIDGRTEHVRTEIFTAYKDVMRAVRQGDWKLIRYPQVHRTQLFNLREDPDEITDLADAQPSKVEAMMKLLAQQQKLFGDPVPLTSETPEPATIDADTLTQNRGKQRGRARLKRSKK